MLSSELYKRLEDAVGPENISQDMAILESYTWQSFLEIIGQTDGWNPYRPVAVVLPESTEEVQSIVRICNANGLQYKAYSTGFGVWSVIGDEKVVQIDLRRMDRILDIDDKNMFAVVEPYVSGAQLQAEAMKLGLNTHIIGAGCGTSPLASATSLMGYGWSGITTGYSARNVLGVEWVQPDGEILKLGSLGQDCSWFSGDGPGPSLRGVMRGYVGACGGLGVFTKAGLKLFNWPGPSEPEVEGLLIDTRVEIPETSGVYMCIFPNAEKFAEAGYKIAGAEIGYIHCKNAIGSTFSVNTPKLMNKIVKFPALKEALSAAQHVFQFIIAANSKREFEYQEKVLKQIIADTGGVLMETGGIPQVASVFWWGFIRASMSLLIFRRGGSFGTSFGALDGWDHPVYQSVAAAKIKQDFIDRGKLMDDLGDNSWGGIYEGSTGFGHQEELYMYDPRSPEQMEGAGEFLLQTLVETVKNNMGPGLAFAGGALVPEFFGPAINNYHTWLREIKKIFDANNASDPCFYISPEPERDLPRGLEKADPVIAAKLGELLANAFADGENQP
jgi:glycolate dehydrogenase FAD-linked subunit